MRWRARMTTRSRRCTASTKHAPTWPARSGRWKRFTPSEETMSIEIEVGLENAAKVMPTAELPLEEEAPKASLNSKVRGLFLLGGAVLVAAAAGLFFYFHNRESTDDAQVDGHITPVASKIYGRVAEVLVQDNEQVKAGQVLVKTDPRDYQASLDQAHATVSSAHAEVMQVKMRSADAQAKLAKVQQARAALEAAQLNLSYTEIVAPVAGVSTHKQVEAGQIVQAGQGLLVVVPLQDVWVTANFKETQLKNMKPGQKAEVNVDTYGKTFPGHVDSIAGATGAVLSLLPPENATGNYVKVVQRIPVKIVLDPIPPEKAILRPGMNVDATVITQ